MALKNPFDTLTELSKHSKIHFYSLPALEKSIGKPISRLPISLRIIIESLLRHCDGKKVKEEEILRLSSWSGAKKSQGDTPFVVSRVLLQDFTGVPLLVDLAAMRDAAVKLGFDPKMVEPLVPVDLIIDHSVQVDRSGTLDAFDFNLNLEFARNKERYAFLKWGQQAFKTFKVFPPGIGICHQVNLEFLGEVVSKKAVEGHQVAFFDTLVGTDSHTTMINGLGVVGWGVGGIEGEAAMLGQPLALDIPEVVGFHLSKTLPKGVTPTDLTLKITEILRNAKVVGKFVEFFGDGAASLSVADRAMIANMAPEYGATMGFFPPDEKTLEYLSLTNRSKEQIQFVKEYLQAQGMFGMPKEGQLEYSEIIDLDLSTLTPCVAGPKRPQDRVALSEIKKSFHHLLHLPADKGGYGKTSSKPLEKIYVHSNGEFSLEKEHIYGGKDAETPGLGRNEEEMVGNRPMMPPVINPGYVNTKEADLLLSHGSIVIAAITSCTNTSNPYVMLAAGLLAKKAVEKGLKVNPLVKTSLAPGSRVVTDYLEKTGLQASLNRLGFDLVAYGCTTCIGNSGPLDERLESAIKEYDVIAASVLSGNRNFEARIHGSVKANFLMSPPLVVAFALAGRIDIDFENEPVGFDPHGREVYLQELWPKDEEINHVMEKAIDPSMFVNRYQKKQSLPIWEHIHTASGTTYQWDKKSTYIQDPPYFEDFSLEPEKKKPLKEMRALALLGDSVTTDHISPAGHFRKDSAAGQYLMQHGVSEEDFNSYGSRRGNHEVMMRGTFANVRIKNALAEGREGGYTKHIPSGQILSIFDAAQLYKKENTPLIIFAGKDYGMGSSRDWAAKGSALLGVKVIVAKSFERIHRSNLVGMGILPLQFKENQSVSSLNIKGDELFSLEGAESHLKPKQEMTLLIQRNDGTKEKVSLLLRIDTPIEVEYYEQGGIMPYVLKQIIKSSFKK